MKLAIECVVFCLIMWLICFLSTGNDEKNIKSLRSYPKEIKVKISSLDKYKDKIKPTNNVKVFISNFILFLVILFVFGIFIRSNKFINNFVDLLILGQTMNLFDLLIIDLCWWRNTKRIRFSEIPEKSPYQNAKGHFISFLNAFIMFILIAVVDGLILTLF